MTKSLGLKLIGVQEPILQKKFEELSCRLETTRFENLFNRDAHTSTQRRQERSPGVNFINILCVHFTPIFWQQKLQS